MHRPLSLDRSNKIKLPSTPSIDPLIRGNGLSSLWAGCTGTLSLGTRFPTSPDDPSIDPLLALAEHAADFARNKFKDTGEVSPMIIADTADGHRLVVPTVLGSAEQKDAVSESLRAQFKAKGVVRYAAMMEAWMDFGTSGPR